MKLFTLLFFTILMVAAAFAQLPPPQPATGPGGSDYPHAQVTALGPFWPSGLEGNDNFRYFVYQPASPKPAAAPVVLFLHGYFANFPEVYLRWMNHMARKGFTVIWVQYDAGFSPPRDFANNALASYRDALRRIQADPTLVQPRRNASGEMLTGITGHSLGGYLTMVLAARATEMGSGIPVPQALAPVEAAIGLTPGANYGSIPAATKVVFLVGEDDTLVCKFSTTTLWNAIGQIPEANKDFLAMRTDTYGRLDLVANHFFPMTIPLPDRAVDARDFYGTWKVSTGVFQCAFDGVNCDYVLSNGGSLQVGMGNWSDSQPVTPMTWAASPVDVTLPCETRAAQTR